MFSLFNLDIFELAREVMKYSSHALAPVMNISAVWKIAIRTKKPGTVLYRA